jgi:hypothetical protein
MPSESSHPHGEVFLDTRGSGRALRLTWHHEADVVVLSLWRDRLCAGTFRLAKSDVNEFVDALVEGLRETPGAPATSSASPPQTGEVQVTEQVTPVAQESASFADWAFGDDPSRATA